MTRPYENAVAATFDASAANSAPATTDAQERQASAIGVGRLGPAIEALAELDDEPNGEGTGEQQRRGGVPGEGGLHRGTRSGEVAQPSPDRGDRRLEVAEGDGSTLLETFDAVRHDEVRDERRGRAHPVDL